MARARNIKPGFAKNEDLAECSFAARLCFALLPTLADREGRLEDRPKRIKGELFPFDSIEVDPLLAELAKHGFIERYAAEGRGLIQIIAFHKHQHPHHKEPESDLPPPPSLRLAGDGKWVKPEALPSCDDGQALGFGGLHEPKAPDKTETSPGLDPPRVDLQGGSNPADSGALIPERGFRSADPGGIPEPTALVASASPPRLPPCPTDELIALFHRHLPTLPRVEIVNDGRRKHLTARWRDVLSDPEIAAAENPRAAAIEWFAWFFEHAGSSRFLTGQAKDWRASFDWLIAPSNFVKVAEGNYHRRVAA